MIKNIVFVEAHKINTISNISLVDIPVLEFRVHLPEIVINGNRIKKHTDSIYLTVDITEEAEYIGLKIFNKYKDLKAYLEEYRAKFSIAGAYGIERFKFITNIFADFCLSPNEVRNRIEPEIISIINACIVKQMANYILINYSDYDGYNIQNPVVSGTIITEYSKNLLERFIA